MGVCYDTFVSNGQLGGVIEPTTVVGSFRLRVERAQPSAAYVVPIQKINEEKTIQEKPRMNGQIRISPIRVVSAEGEMLGEMATSDALKTASELGLDLVEVSPEARPPVCRIMDYGKVQYENNKKQVSGAKKHHQQRLKQIRLRAKTGQHDVDFKVRQARAFLERKDKVKVTVQFRGRENAHHERGRDMLVAMIETLADVSNVERAPGLESGRIMTMTLIPKP